MADYETSTKSAPDEISTLVFDGVACIPFMTIFFIFVMYIIVESSLFNEKVLAKINPNFVDNTMNKQESGIICTAVILSVVVGLLECLHTYKII